LVDREACFPLAVAAASSECVSPFENFVGGRGREREREREIWLRLLLSVSLVEFLPPV